MTHGAELIGYDAKPNALGCLVLPEELIKDKDLVVYIESMPIVSKKAVFLIDDIKARHGAVTVTLTNDEDSPAYWLGADKTIYLSRSLCKDQLEFISNPLFEMCNAANEYIALDQHKISNSMNAMEIIFDLLLETKDNHICDKLREGYKNTNSQKLQAGKYSIDYENKWKLSMSFEEYIVDNVEPFSNFEDCWKFVNSKDSSPSPISHADFYRKFFSRNSLYYLEQRRDPQTDREWQIVCLGISALSFMWQKQETKLFPLFDEYRKRESTLVPFSN